MQLPGPLMSWRMKGCVPLYCPCVRLANGCRVETANPSVVTQWEGTKGLQLDLDLYILYLYLFLAMPRFSTLRATEAPKRTVSLTQCSNVIGQYGVI